MSRVKMNDQRSVSDQLDDLERLAVEKGMYDAQDWIRARRETLPFAVPRVSRTMSVRAGGCNFCTRHITRNGDGNHHVTVIEGPQLTVRMCDACLSQVKRSQ